MKDYNISTIREETRFCLLADFCNYTYHRNVCLHYEFLWPNNRLYLTHLLCHLYYVHSKRMYHNFKFQQLITYLTIWIKQFNLIFVKSRIINIRMTPKCIQTVKKYKFYQTCFHCYFKVNPLISKQ